MCVAMQALVLIEEVGSGEVACLMLGWRGRGGRA